MPRLGSNYHRLFSASTISNLGDGVGLVAYPWLASALTRNPMLLSAVLVAQRIPWLLFSLPIGVVVDRYRRRLLMVTANAGRAILTAAVALAVVVNQSSLPAPDELDDLLQTGSGIPTKPLLFGLLLLAAFLLGAGEVLHDTAAMSIMPHVVSTDELETANGRLVSAEQATNLFVGPLFGAFLLTTVFAAPFFVDASSFLLAAGILALTPIVEPRPAPSHDDDLSWPQRFRVEFSQGFTALWSHGYLRFLAIVATVVNLMGGAVLSILVLFAQEILLTDPTRFSLLSIGSAIGSVVGGFIAPKLSDRFGSSLVLRFVVIGVGLCMLTIVFTSSWIVTSAMLGVYGFLVVCWVVLTVSLRQAITANEVLGRVNSVYRFFSFGAISLGAMLGGFMIWLAELGVSREMALRTPFLAAAVVQLAVAVYAFGKLSGQRLAEVRNGPPTGSLP
jgi:MFS family permease